MIRVKAPDPVEGERLAAELVAAGLPATSVVLAGADVQVGGVTEDDRAAVESVVAAHSPPAATPPPTVEERLAALEERVDRAANVAVTDLLSDAAKIRDGLKP